MLTPHLAWLLGAQEGSQSKEEDKSKVIETLTKQFDEEQEDDKDYIEMGEGLVGLSQDQNTAWLPLTKKCCLALLKGTKASTMCKCSADCKISGKGQTRAANPLIQDSISSPLMKKDPI
eukprot:6621966-Ditylum_brightwellii.AAC.1